LVGQIFEVFYFKILKIMHLPMKISFYIGGVLVLILFLLTQWSSLWEYYKQYVIKDQEIKMNWKIITIHTKLEKLGFQILDFELKKNVSESFIRDTIQELTITSKEDRDLFLKDLGNYKVDFGFGTNFVVLFSKFSILKNKGERIYVIKTEHANYMLILKFKCKRWFFDNDELNKMNQDIELIFTPE
jgi:hypothetical protein